MISVIIPVYNVERYLVDCLDSVIGQGDVDLEIICVNDGSTDSSLVILQSYAEKNNNITIISQDNQGLSCARNAGLRVAKGDYVYFLDSDDMLAPNSLAAMYAYAKAESLDVLYFDADVFYENDELRKRFPLFNKQYKRKKTYGVYENGKDLFVDMVNSGDYMVSACLQLLSLHYLKSKDLHFCPHILHEDNLFNFQCMLQAGKVGHVADTYYIRRVRNASIMTKEKRFENFYGMYISCQRMLDFLDKIQLGAPYIDVALFVIDDLYEIAGNMFVYELSKAEQEKIKKLSPIDKHNIDRMTKDKRKIYQECQYPFPSYLLPQDSRIILYGAGNIGKRYFRQLKENHYAQIVGWADKDYEVLQEEGFPVEPIDELIEKDYDYIFISIANEAVAEEIIEMLVGYGVAREKIIWKGSDYCVEKNTQMTLLNKRLEIMSQYTQSKCKKIFLFMTPEHGNLGDYAIALAERKFFEKYFAENVMIEVTTPDWLNYRKEYLDIITEEDIICISGGGYLGNMWTSGSVVKDIISSFKANVKFMFPNTLTYVNNDVDAMKEDAFFYAKQNKLYIFAREEASYKKMIELGYRSQEQICLFPDMALSLNYSENVSVEGDGVLLCFRQDEEKVLKDETVQTIKCLLDKNKVAYKMTDIHLHKRVERVLGESELLAKINEFRKAKLVITDRLHGMILATITGTPCLAFDNVTGKVSGVYKWLENAPYVRCIGEEKLTKKLLWDFINLEAPQYNELIVHEYMMNMAQYIRERVG